MSGRVIQLPLKHRIDSKLHQAADLCTVAEHWQEEGDEAQAETAIRDARKAIAEARELLKEIPR